VDGKVLAGGFDHSYSLNDQDRYFNPQKHTLDDEPLPAVKLVEPRSSRREEAHSGPEKEGQSLLTSAATPGYYATTAIAQHAIDMLAGHQATNREQPFLLYLAFTAPHFPLQALPQDFAIYQDRYHAGWDALRQERYARMTKMGLINCALSKLQPDVAPGWNLPEQKLREEIGTGEVGRAVAWDSLTPEEKKFQPIKMALHAAMIHRMDIEIGRVLDQLKAMKVFDNTVIFFVSDNGASANRSFGATATTGRRRRDRRERTFPSGRAGRAPRIRPSGCTNPGCMRAASPRR